MPHAHCPVTSNPRFLQSLGLALGRRLIRQINIIADDSLSPHRIEVDEYDALVAQVKENGHRALPLFSFDSERSG